MKSSFDFVVDGVTLEVCYMMEGFGADCELEEVLIFIGEQEVTPILSEKVAREIDEKCMEHFWSSAPDAPDYEPEEDL